MADYIDRDGLLNQRPEYLNTKTQNGYTNKMHKGWNDCNSEYYEIITNLPSVDAVEVIRCKDCKYRETTNVMNFCKRLCEIEKDTDVLDRAVYLEVKDNDFCKWGEKE